MCGWLSFVHGEATAGDVLSLDVRHRVQDAGIPHDVAWSPVMRPSGGVLLDEVGPADCSDVVFVCGPAHGTRCGGCTSSSPAAGASRST